MASSLLWILSLYFVRHMLAQTWRIYNYYAAYYLAKWWLELSFAQLHVRDVWFAYTLSGNTSLVYDTFYTWISSHVYGLTTSILGISSLISERFWMSSWCDTPLVLFPGETFVLPLFRDMRWGNVDATLASWVFYQNLAYLFQQDLIDVITDMDGEVVFGMLILSGDVLSQNGTFFHKWSLRGWLPMFRKDFESYLQTLDDILYPVESLWSRWYATSWMIDQGFRMYLMINNADKYDISFCLAVRSDTSLHPWALPTPATYVRSQAFYQDQQVVLDAMFAQPVPSFLFETYTSW